MKHLPVYILALAFMLHRCKPESPCDENQRAEHLTYNLEPGTKEQIPYRADGLDTLVYISDAGDTATLYGQGVDSFYRSESKNRNPDPDCPVWDSWKYENIEISFKSNNPKLTSLTMSYYRTDKNSSYDQFELLLNSQLRASNFLAHLNSVSEYSDSITINNKMLSCSRFVDVTKYPYDSSLTCYYSSTFGVVGIQKRGDNLWKALIK